MTQKHWSAPAIAGDYGGSSVARSASDAGSRSRRRSREPLASLGEARGSAEDAEAAGKRRRSCSTLALFLLLVSGCRQNGAPPPGVEAKAVVIWKTVGSWSGRGSRQTETFTSDTGGFRVRWETKNAARPGAGHLRVIFRSGDSGREIIDAVNEPHVGSDSDIAEVSADRPRWYYLTIDSAEVDWTVTVDERIDARVRGSS